MKKQKFYLIPAEIVDSNFPDEIKEMRKTTLISCEVTDAQFINLKKGKNLTSLINGKTDKPLNKSQQITKHFDAYLAGGDDLSYTKIHTALKNALKEKPDYMVESITVRHKGEDVNICLIEDLEYTTVKRFCEMCGIE